MSYVGPDFEPAPPRRSALRRPLTVAVAALVPGALAGWLLWQVTGDSEGSAGAGGGTAAPASSSAAAAPAPSGESGEPTAGDGADPTPAEPTPADSAPSAPSSASAPAASGPLKGKVVVVDPGHNPGNFEHATEINRQVDIGTNRKECDTTGTASDAGYREADFTLDVARRLRTALQQQGATVRFTQDDDRPWGPCVDERARIGNDAGADAVVSIHADGSGAGNRGFHVILPGAVRAGGADTRAIVGPSRELGARIAGRFVAVTGSAPANYVGDGTGLVTREDLGGLNLSTVPKVFIECGNMRDSADLVLLSSGAWRQKAAQGISEGIVSFLRT
ncbi:N-acetylmuramoyl-L-alanine amidase [Streptomyces sp. CRN 30]|uniref:N-acetylmuramoyl-L-alanine amidase n=1 Tax=Streptomyces sp. CRN 30 TaxID=3075613 RepID=UPI002A821204|nr:N-acetylmuramoyl-L-alanine amidase [Streptomyces sp. CRN 30]